MGGTGVIDQFLETFTRYIDSGFGLLGGDVGYLATTLAAIDVTLAGLFWAWGSDEDIIARLVRKTLFVGVFAANSTNGAILQALRRGAGDSLNQTGQQVVRRNINIQPTLTIRPGFPVRVIVNRDLVLEIYKG